MDLQQPNLTEFGRKRQVFARLVEMGVQLQRARRRLGYVELMARTTVPDLAADEVVVRVKQSGLIEVVFRNPAPGLRLESPRLVWDEAMFVEAMTDV